MINKAPSPNRMTSAIAIGAGLAAALLYAVAQKPGFIAAILSKLSPLPVMIAALGFGGTAGLAAAVIGSVAVTVIALAQHAHSLTTAQAGGAALDGLFFALLQGLPAWWLGRLATTSGAPPADGRDSPSTRGALDTYPLGRVLGTAVAIAIAGILLAVAVNSIDIGSYQAMMAKLAHQFEPIVATIVGADHELFGDLDVKALSRMVALGWWPGNAASSLVTLMGNLWLAGRVVQVSHRLRRPWPNIPRELRAPRLLAPLFVVALGLCFAGGVIGAIGTIAAAAIGVAFALQGLAVVHDLTRGTSYRIPLLCAVYLLLTVTMPWPLALFTLIGLVEAGFSLRDRKAASRKA